MTDPGRPYRPLPSVLATVSSSVAVVLAFAVTIALYAGISGGMTKHLTGFSSFLGLPSTGLAIALFSLLVTWSVSMLAGARYRHSVHVIAIVVASIVVVVELIATITEPTWYDVVLLVLAAILLVFVILACRERERVGFEVQVPPSARRWASGVFMVIAGIGGFLGAYNLSLDKVSSYLTPDLKPTCDFSVLVQCSKNLGSAQGSAFGFPNPLIGLGGFTVVFVFGLLILAGAEVSRWFWIAFAVGVAGALAFVIFLIVTSIYFLHTLCPWCMLVWSVTIPLFWLTWLWLFKSGTIPVGERARRFFAGAFTWTPFITLASYIVVALLAQLNLNVIQYL